MVTLGCSLSVAHAVGSLLVPALSLSLSHFLCTCLCTCGDDQSEKGRGGSANRGNGRNLFHLSSYPLYFNGNAVRRVLDEINTSDPGLQGSVVIELSITHHLFDSSVNTL